ncbi:MAG: adenine deaminase, partial [Desulfobacterales bacterium]|nr:adenine deaminase [Desulfobacterales bacterium]
MQNNHPFPRKGAAEIKMLMNAGLGLEPADLVIENARVLNVYTGEILDHLTVGVKGAWIAYVGEPMKSLAGPDTEVIDAGGKVVAPGLIDGHTHLAWLYSPEEFLKHAMAGGTTTIITETMEPYPVSGFEGVVDFLEALKDQPVKILATAPAMVSISRAVRGISMVCLKKLLARDDIVGLGESYWQGIFQEPDLFIPILRETLAAGKILEGHSAGARRSRLNAYAGVGPSSCHEPIDADQVLERLRLGLHVMAREGSIRRDLEKIVKIKETGVSLRRLTLVSDGVTPTDLTEKGYMEFIVQKAIDLGFDPVSAIRMATLNVAEHFSLDDQIGGVAPGRCADMLILPDIRTIKPEYVISNGRIIARDGAILASPRPHRFSGASWSSIRIRKKFAPSDFVIPAEG